MKETSRISVVAGLAAFLVSMSIPAAAQSSAPSLGLAPSPVHDAQRDFDFEFGTWKTKLSRRLRPLTGSNEWAQYEGTTVVTPVWNGRASLVELAVDGPAGHIEALSLRLFDVSLQQWSLNFSAGGTGQLSPPSVGRFKGGRGEFFNEEMLDGRSIRVRFVIEMQGPTTCRFEQSFSADNGKTWEVNWIATDTRQ